MNIEKNSAGELLAAATCIMFGVRLDAATRSPWPNQRNTSGSALDTRCHRQKTASK
jgi:hypothetical protein